MVHGYTISQNKHGWRYSQSERKEPLLRRVIKIIAQLLQKNEATYLPLKNCCKVMRNMLNRVLREPEKRTPTL